MIASCSPSSSPAEPDAALARSDGDPSRDDGAVTSEAPAYGIFQLYGDEYAKFRERMGQTLEDYWRFVDQHVATLGVRFTRTNTLLIWGLVEPTLGEGYNWQNTLKTDQVLKAVYAPASGKEMDILLVIEPGRGAPKSGSYPKGLESEYQRYVRAVVERYRAGGPAGVAVRHWQVMNEPFFQLNDKTLTVDEYLSLVKLTAEAVRAVVPNARLVLGDLGEHLAEVVPRLAGVSFDAVDIHFWCMREPCAYQYPKLASVRSLLDANGHPATEIWMGEFGSWVNGAKGLPTHSAEDQARWLLKAMVANRAAGVSRILWNTLAPWTNFAGSADSPFNFMSLLSNGTASGDPADDVGRERIAYQAYRRLIAETSPRAARLVGELPAPATSVRAFRFEGLGGGSSRTLLWSDAGEQSATLSCASASVQVQGLVPSSSGEFPEAQTQACSGGSLQLQVGLDPLLVTGL
jgi:hypothetical protein